MRVDSIPALLFSKRVEMRTSAVSRYQPNISHARIQPQIRCKMQWKWKRENTHNASPRASYFARWESPNDANVHSQNIVYICVLHFSVTFSYSEYSVELSFFFLSSKDTTILFLIRDVFCLSSALNNLLWVIKFPSLFSATMFVRNAWNFV